MYVFLFLTSTSMGDRNCQQTRKKRFGFFPSIFSSITLSRLTPAREQERGEMKPSYLSRSRSSMAVIMKCRLKEVKFTKYECDGEHLEEGQKHKRHHSCVVIHQLKHIYPTLHTRTQYYFTTISSVS